MAAINSPAHSDMAVAITPDIGPVNLIRQHIHGDAEQPPDSIHRLSHLATGEYNIRQDMLELISKKGSNRIQVSIRKGQQEYGTPRLVL